MRRMHKQFYIFLFFINSMCVKSEKPLVPALYVFGDSLSDSGNNNFLPTIARANLTPYGVDFGGPTGRFSNGKTFMDFIAQSLRLPFVPPYLGLSSAQRLKTITGINYASSSAGILPETGRRLGKSLPYNTQLDFFNKTVKEDLIPYFNSSTALAEYLSKAIFMVDIGSNDYLNNYLQAVFYLSSIHYSHEKFAQLLIDRLSEGLQRLYNLGARKMVVFEIGAVGCIPTLTNTIIHEGACVDEVNKIVMFFNDRLPKLLNLLQSKLPSSVFVCAKTFEFGYVMIQNPSDYGFLPANKPCCIGRGRPCLEGSPPCKNRNEHFFYDGIHPSEIVNSIAAGRCFNQSSGCTPLNIEQLARV